VIAKNIEKPVDALEMAELCIRELADRKAREPVLLKVSGLCSFADYFIVCSGKSSRQVQGIADRLVTDLKRRGIKALGVEGEREGKWVLIDYGDVVIHVFYDPVRQLYDLESLWSDAPRVSWEADDSSGAKTLGGSEG